MVDKKKERIQRQKMPEQEPKVRIKNFEEVPYGYTEEQALLEARRCLQCKKPQCVKGCPVEIDIPAFIALVTERKFVEAARLVKLTNALPAVCGRVCPQEEQCEKECILSKKDDAVAIGRLERFVADYERNYAGFQVPEMAKPTGKRVAVVGSGPAGLTCAGDLVRMGHEVHVLEALHKPGGVLVYGIPEFRLPKAILYKEVEYLTSIGVKLRTSFVVGKVKTVDELLADGFDAVFVGSGAGAPNFMFIPGENLLGVYSANEYLTRSNLMKAYLFPKYKTPIAKGKKVAVIGAGNVAMDCARTAIRLGADEVHLVYRRSRSEMPARIEEVHHAEEEGVIFDVLTLPIEYIGDDRGWVRKMRCLKMELGEPDASGRRKPVPIEGSEFEMNVDVVIVAIGNSPNPLIPQTSPHIRTGKGGTIIVDEETMMTTQEGVFAGGDIVSGAATVISAMGHGKRAARGIHRYIMGEM